MTSNPRTTSEMIRMAKVFYYSKYAICLTDAFVD